MSKKPEVDVLGEVGKLLDPAPVDEQFRKSARWQRRLLWGAVIGIFLLILVTSMWKAIFS